ncbi:MAG TPA: M15 family metallopeptidase [Acidimicrobiales bacterium]|nr:M15 family metallopeptidase [Acidimicrobiales bacterium]
MPVRGCGESGQVLPLIVLMVGLIAMLSVQVARVGGAAGLRARAQTAADAAALAGAAAGRQAADSEAAANRARLVDYREIDGDVQVRVRVGEATAQARARGSVAAGGSGGFAAQGSSTGLAPAMRAALARAAALLGRPVPITSGFRSLAEQRALWARRHTNPYPVAPPGTSMHGRGLAVDVPSSFVPTLLRVGRQAGLCQPYPRNDPIHFELCR